MYHFSPEVIKSGLKKRKNVAGDNKFLGSCCLSMNYLSRMKILFIGFFGNFNRPSGVKVAQIEIKIVLTIPQAASLHQMNEL